MRLIGRLTPLPTSHPLVRRRHEHPDWFCMVALAILDLDTMHEPSIPKLALQDHWPIAAYPVKMQSGLSLPARRGGNMPLHPEGSFHFTRCMLERYRQRRVFYQVKVAWCNQHAEVSASYVSVLDKRGSPASPTQPGRRPASATSAGASISLQAPRRKVSRFNNRRVQLGPCESVSLLCRAPLCPGRPFGVTSPSGRPDKLDPSAAPNAKGALSLETS